MPLLFFVLELVLTDFSIGVLLLPGDDADLEPEVVFCALVVIAHFLQSCLKFLFCFLLTQHFTDSLAKSILLHPFDPTVPIGHRGLAILQFRDL